MPGGVALISASPASYSAIREYFDLELKVLQLFSKPATNWLR
jgi:hypothetical protein